MFARRQAAAALRRSLPATTPTALLLRRCVSTSPSATSPWAVLGVARGADLDECKDAYRKLALSLHPDTNPSADAATQFLAVVDAYQQIAGGDARGGGAAGPSGVRSVGGVLVITIDALRRDPRYAVYTCRLALEEEDEGEVGDGTPRRSSSPPPASHDDAAAADSLSADAVHREVACSLWDSVADLRQQLQHELELPPRLRYDSLRGRSGGHELIYRSQLMGEHLLLQDYGVVDGDTMHFAVRQQL